MVIIGQVSGKQAFEQKFEIPFPEDQIFREKYYTDRHEKAWILSYQKQFEFACYHYGMVPFWSKQAVYHYESPVEGSLNPGMETSKKRIILHPSYRKPIRESRCLVPVDYFLLLSESGDPYLIFSSATDTFALAGIYDHWKEDYYDKDFYKGFSILTVSAPEDFRNFGITRLPLIIPERKYKRWMNPDVALAEITALMENTTENDLNAYPISKKLFLQKANTKELCRPRGEMLRQLPQDPGKLASFLRSFRFKRGASHNHPEQEERIWRT